MSRVLLIEDDRNERESWGEFLRHAGFEVLALDCGYFALAVSREWPPDVILCDLVLPDVSGLELLRRLREEGSAVPFIMVTGSGTVRTAVEAMHLGALDYLEKPLLRDEVLCVIERGLGTRRYRVASSSGEFLLLPEAHAAARWAHAVVKVVDAPNDPKTLAGWSQIANASIGTLKNWCRTAGLPGKRSLDFARMLRAVVRASTDGYRPQDSLNAVDKRTLKRLLALGSERRDTQTLPQCIDDFLKAQSFISDSRALTELRRALRSPHG